MSADSEMELPETPTGLSAEHRTVLYAEGTALLDEDCHVVGAEALFDQALTNGLLAIAAWAIPGHSANDPDQRQLPASRVLGDLEAICQVDNGVCTLPTDEPDYILDEHGMLQTLDREKRIRLDVAQLADAIGRTQKARHGRGPGKQVTPEDVAALVALDGHPALGELTGHYNDRDWRRAWVRDRAERFRAEDYCRLLHDDEIERACGGRGGHPRGVSVE
jgi:hypothetical protein